MGVVCEWVCVVYEWVCVVCEWVGVVGEWVGVVSEWCVCGTYAKSSASTDSLPHVINPLPSASTSGFVPPVVALSPAR